MTRNTYILGSLGDVIDETYQVIAKLGYGRSSTVWPAKDICRYVSNAIKLGAVY
ncbi:hypothetical protein EDB19DRAFT_1627428 [Suillus lakei]|nr:hypothetical protein EDB19DRAFT_1627428 [Suillus lakei]